MHPDRRRPSYLHVVDDEFVFHDVDECTDDCCAHHDDAPTDDDFLNNATAYEHYLHDAVANYHHPHPWGCMLGFSHVLRGLLQPRRIHLSLRPRRR